MSACAVLENGAMCVTAFLFGGLVHVLSASFSPWRGLPLERFTIGEVYHHAWKLLKIIFYFGMCVYMGFFSAVCVCVCVFILT